MDTSAPLRLNLDPTLAPLLLEVEYEDRWHRYAFQVGEGLVARLPSVARAALGSGGTGAEVLTLSYSEPGVSCELTRGAARTRIEVLAVAKLGDQELARSLLSGQDETSLGDSFSFGVGSRLLESLDRALDRIDVQHLLFLRRLPLPRAQTPAVTPSSKKEPTLETEAVAAAGEPLAQRLAEAERLLEIGDAAGAERMLSELISAHAANDVLFQRRAVARLHLGELDPALADSFRALELQPESASALATRALLWERRGERARALADCEAALALPHDPTLGAHLRRVRARLESP